MNRLSHLLVVAVLATLVLFPTPLTDKTNRVSSCAQEVYEFCWSQGRPVDKTTCDCNFNSCMSMLPSDCEEQGGYMDISTCTCHMPPGEQSLCDRDPYALGCPRNPDTGGGAGVCSFASYSWCNQNGGQWSSDNCTCNFQTTTGCIAGTSTPDSCTNAGGTWDPNNCVCRGLPRAN